MMRPAFLARLEAIAEAAKRGEPHDVDDDILLAAQIDALARRWGVDPRIIQSDVEWYTNLAAAGDALPAAVTTYRIKVQENRRAADEAAFLAHRAQEEAQSEPVID